MMNDIYLLKVDSVTLITGQRNLKSSKPAREITQTNGSILLNGFKKDANS